MKNNISETIGCDLGDKASAICVLDTDGHIKQRTSLPTTRKAMKEFFAREAAHVVIEVGAHSRWVSQLLTNAGRRVTVANPRRVQLISASDNKTDSHDAELLARLGRADVELLCSGGASESGGTEGSRCSEGSRHPRRDADQPGQPRARDGQKHRRADMPYVYSSRACCLSGLSGPAQQVSSKASRGGRKTTNRPVRVTAKRYSSLRARRQIAAPERIGPQCAPGPTGPLDECEWKRGGAVVSPSRGRDRQPGFVDPGRPPHGSIVSQTVDACRSK